jgi:hypothetical protein
MALAGKRPAKESIMELPLNKIDWPEAMLKGLLAIVFVTGTSGFAAFAGVLDTDSVNNVPMTNGPDPSLTNSQKWAPSTATAGTADAGPALSHSTVSAIALTGHGVGCVPTSPCAAVLPLADHAPRVSSRSVAPLLSGTH